MISVTNNATQFFENDKEVETIIYGAGNSGKWVGHFMTRTGYDYSCYLDKGAIHEGALLNGKPIFLPKRLELYSGKSIKIIVSAICYKEICSDLLWLERKYGFNALCFVPQYTDSIYKCETYNINKFLGFFRRKLLKGDAPTFISNDCTEGYLYDFLGMMINSPTTDNAFELDDFLKLCYNPKMYLNKEISNIHWERRYDMTYQPVDSLVGNLGDIRIIFAHNTSTDSVLERWPLLRKQINWNRLVFTLQDGHHDIPLYAVKSFNALSQKHLLISMRSHYGIESDSIVYFKSNWIHNRECVLENNFDLLEWINRGD